MVSSTDQFKFVAGSLSIHGYFYCIGIVMETLSIIPLINIFN